MLNPNQIKTEINSSILSISALVVREQRDRLDNGEVFYEPMLQFQVTNISDLNVVGLETEVNYYSSNNQFLGSDSDLRLEPLKPEEKETFTLLIEVPEETSRAELVVKGNGHGFREKVNSLFRHPIFLVAVFVLLIYSNVKN